MRIEISKQARVLCAVSGGADSMALLHRLHELYITGQLAALTAAHFNHGLRPEADGEESFVQSFCAERGLDCRVGRGDVYAQARRDKTGIEEAARTARYAFLYSAAEQVGADTIVTAHHADDNLETMLLNLTRGAGPEGMRGIPPRRGALYRPMLHITRREIEEYLRRHNIPHIEDASNRDIRFRRNRLRYEVLPVLRDINPRAASAAEQTARLLRQDAELLEALTDREMDEAGELPGGMSYPADRLTAMPPALSGRVLRRLCRDCGLYSAEHRHIEALLALCRSKNPHASLNLPGGLAARRVYGQLVIGVPEPEPNAAFTLTVSEAEPGVNIHKTFNTFFVAGDTIKGILAVRTRESGDRFQPAGRGVTKSVKKWMIDEKVPRSMRGRLPVITDENGIVAITGLGVAQGHEPGAGRTLKLVVSRESSMADEMATDSGVKRINNDIL